MQKKNNEDESIFGVGFEAKFKGNCMFFFHRQSNDREFLRKFILNKCESEWQNRAQARM